QSSNTRSQTSFVFDLTQCPSPPFKQSKKPHDVRPFQDLSLRIKIAIGTTGFEPAYVSIP
ncbi:hypothetical protein, partial [Streptococcus pneumoniae]